MDKLLSNREWLSLSVIGLTSLLSILPAASFLIFGRVPAFWLEEGGLYESLGSAACLFAGLIFLFSFRISLNQKQTLWAAWMLLFALGCLFIAGEEVSWGQHIFGFKGAESITSTNFQNEFNLHNSMLIQSSNNSISFFVFHLLMLYFILLPMIAVAFPGFQALLNRVAIPVPGMQIAIIAFLAKAADLVNHKVIYGASFDIDRLHLGEGVETIMELCLLILAVECYILTKRKLAGQTNRG